MTSRRERARFLVLYLYRAVLGVTLADQAVLLAERDLMLEGRLRCAACGERNPSIPADRSGRA